MAEIIVVKDTAGGLDLLHRCENVTYTYEGRPHWGQVNSLTGSNGLVRRLYPKLETWLAVRNKIDPIGTFTSPFSQRTCGDESIVPHAGFIEGWSPVSRTPESGSRASPSRNAYKCTPKARITDENLAICWRNLLSDVNKTAAG